MIKLQEMNFEIFKKSCPSCKSKIDVGFWSIREGIKRCPNCGVLLIENPKGKLISGIVFFVGILLASSSQWLGIPVFLGLLIIIFSIIVALQIIAFKTVKRDLVIKNKENNQISFVNNSDWIEIVNNSVHKENKFEIIEHLK
jgi:hypothetical protein